MMDECVVPSTTSGPAQVTSSDLDGSGHRGSVGFPFGGVFVFSPLGWVAGTGAMFTGQNFLFSSLRPRLVGLLSICSASRVSAEASTVQSGCWGLFRETKSLSLIDWTTVKGSVSVFRPFEYCGTARMVWKLEMAKKITMKQNMIDANLEKPFFKKKIEQQSFITMNMNLPWARASCLSFQFFCRRVSRHTIWDVWRNPTLKRQFATKKRKKVPTPPKSLVKIPSLPLLSKHTK